MRRLRSFSPPTNIISKHFYKAYPFRLTVISCESYLRKKHSHFADYAALMFRILHRPYLDFRNLGVGGTRLCFDWRRQVKPKARSPAVLTPREDWLTHFILMTHHELKARSGHRVSHKKKVKCATAKQSLPNNRCCLLIGLFQLESWPSREFFFFSRILEAL